jgi:hypothetical protein
VRRSAAQGLIAGNFINAWPLPGPLKLAGRPYSRRYTFINNAIYPFFNKPSAEPIKKEDKTKTLFDDL